MTTETCGDVLQLTETDQVVCLRVPGHSVECHTNLSEERLQLYRERVAYHLDPNTSDYEGDPQDLDKPRGTIEWPVVRNVN